MKSVCPARGVGDKLTDVCGVDDHLLGAACCVLAASTTMPTTWCWLPPNDWDFPGESTPSDWLLSPQNLSLTTTALSKWRCFHPEMFVFLLPLLHQSLAGVIGVNISWNTRESGGAIEPLACHWLRPAAEAVETIGRRHEARSVRTLVTVARRHTLLASLPGRYACMRAWVRELSIDTFGIFWSR